MQNAPRRSFVSSRWRPRGAPRFRRRSILQHIPSALEVQPTKEFESDRSWTDDPCCKGFYQPISWGKIWSKSGLSGFKLRHFLNTATVNHELWRICTAMRQMLSPALPALGVGVCRTGHDSVKQKDWSRNCRPTNINIRKTLWFLELFILQICGFARIAFCFVVFLSSCAIYLVQRPSDLWYSSGGWYHSDRPKASLWPLPFGWQSLPRRSESGVNWKSVDSQKNASSLNGI